MPQINLPCSTAKIRPEIELVLDCVGSSGAGPGCQERVAALIGAGGIDWNFALEFATRHGLMPLFHRRLPDCCPDHVPADVLDRLRVYGRRVSALNTYLFSELVAIVRGLESRGVPVVCWKGPTLAVEAYGSLQLRQFSDLDLIVRARDVPRATEILRARGFVLTPELSEAQQAMLLRTQCNLPFTRERQRVIVELHWGVAAKHFSRPFDAHNFWERLREIMINGEALKILSREDLFLSLCVHGSKHMWERLSWVSDLSGLLNSEPELDWPLLIRSARQSGCERFVLLGVSLARRLFGTALPKQIEEQLKLDPTIELLAVEIVERLTLSFNAKPRMPGLAAQLIFHLRARRRWQDKVRYLGFVFSPTDEDLHRFRLPKHLTFAYYALRPLRLFFNGGARHPH